jgi:hypothetical protein
MHQFTPSLKAGIEYNPRVDEIGVVANWRALDETRRRPALIFGTSSDRIGTPEGQSYYATVSKSLHHDIGVPVAPYAGISWSTAEDRFLFPFGVNVRVTESVSAMVINDGVHTHLSGTYSWRRYSLTLLAVERRDIGVTIGLAF